MNFIYRTIIALLIVFALKYLWIFYADKNIYNVTHINVCKTNSSTTGPNSSQDHYDTIILARFFTEDIVNEIYTNNIYEDLDKEIDKGTVTHLDYLMFYKSIYLGVISKRYSTSSCKCKIEDIRKFTGDTYNKNLRNFIKPEKEGRIIVRGDAFFEYRLQVQDFMWKIFNNTCIVFPSFTIKPVTDKQNLLYANFVDGSTAVSYKTKKLYTLKFDMFSDNSDMSKDLAKHFESNIKKFGQNNYNHCLVDLTSLYVDLFSDFYDAFCRPKNPKAKRKIMVDLRKSMNIYIIHSLSQVFETISKSANEHKQRNTVIFDIVTILEYLTLNFSIPRESYSLIIDNLTSILEDIHITAREVWRNHGVKGSLESLEKHDFIYLKIFAHKNTNEFIGLLAMHLSKSDFAVVDQLTKKALLVGTAPLPRWIFEGTIVERIVDMYTARSDLIKIYKKISQLIVDSCENHDKTETKTCLECKLTKKLFGLICKNIDAYRKSLDHYTEYNYYQNMDEMIEFGFENTYRSGSESRAFSDVSKSDEDLPASPNSSIDLNTTNGPSNETTEWFEVAKENENKTKQNKVVKVKKVHVSSKEKLMRQIQEEKERKMKQNN